MVGGEKRERLMRTQGNDPPHEAAGAKLTDAAGICEARQRVELAYDPQLLRDAGHRLVDLLSDHLTKAQASQGQVLPWHEPTENMRLAEAAIQQPTGSAAGRRVLADHFGQLVETKLSHGHNLHDPCYLGHQVAASVPDSGRPWRRKIQDCGRTGRAKAATRPSPTFARTRFRLESGTT